MRYTQRIPNNRLYKTFTNTTYQEVSRKIQNIEIRKDSKDKNNTISSVELETLFNGHDNEDFDVVLSVAISNNIITADNALVSLISRFGSRNSLYSISKVLRQGGNPNIYVNDPELNNSIHLMAYLYYRWYDVNKMTNRGIFNMLNILLVHYGVNPNKKVSDETGGMISDHHKSGSDMTNDNTSNKYNPTVFEWITNKKYDNDLDLIYPNYSQHIDTETSTLLGILIGSNENINVNTLDETHIERVIRAGTNSLLSMGVRPKTMMLMDYSVTDWSIKYFNFQSFKYYVSLGYNISYINMNKLIVGIRKYTKSGDVLLYNIYINMLEESILSGRSMDSDQGTLLESSSKMAHDRIMMKYRVPYWTKTCNYRDVNLVSDTVIPERLRITALSLDIELDTDRNNVCSILKDYSSVDSKLLEKAAANRQMARFAAKHGRLDEYIEGITPNKALVCFNSSSIVGNYYDYAEICSSSYRDSGGRIWCFLSSSFDYIIDNKKNPINGTPLPRRYINDVTNKLNYLKSINVDHKIPIKHSTAISELTKTDAIDNTETNKQIQLFYNIMLKKGIDKEAVNELSIENMKSSVSIAGYDKSFEFLIKSHAVIVLSYIVNWLSITNKNTMEMVVNRLISYITANVDQNAYK